ncbi:MAG: LAGLIDADG family homing endonuclease, partial [Agrobacterium sp.]|uniref:LAGLIDADG family homing endonuclease n=1 Tax=Agrobacterium sp. TaxID=361 RepID=UPI004037B69B
CPNYGQGAPKPHSKNIGTVLKNVLDGGLSLCFSSFSSSDPARIGSYGALRAGSEEEKEEKHRGSRLSPQDVYFLFCGLLVMPINNNKDKVKDRPLDKQRVYPKDKAYSERYVLSKKHIKGFIVGLIDGDGSIQVNHWRKTSLQYRIVVKLNYTASNYQMLSIICAFLKVGKVALLTSTSKGVEVIWVINHRKEIIVLLTLFKEYPLLHCARICQYIFMLECMEHNNVIKYLETRERKYNILDNVLNQMGDITKKPYYNSWLSGFITAEGIFCIRKNGNHSFSIAQKYSKYLLESIKQTFGLKSKVRSLPSQIYALETYSKDSLNTIYNFCHQYPLLGHKRTQMSLQKTLISSKHSAELEGRPSAGLRAPETIKTKGSVETKRHNTVNLLD